MTLKDRIANLKRSYWWRTGNEAELLIVPRVQLRAVCQHLADEFDGMPPKHHIYHALTTGEGAVTVLGLEVRINSDTNESELAVGVEAS